MLRSFTAGAVSTGATTSAAITPVQILPQTSPAPLAAGSSVTSPSSGLVSTALATLVHNDSWSIAYQSFHYGPPDEIDKAMLARADISQRLTCVSRRRRSRMTIVGMAYFEEIGRRTN